MRAIPANDLSPFGRHQPYGALRRLLHFTQNAGTHWLGQRAALLVRRFGLRRLRARPVDVTVETLKARMRLYPFNNASEKRLLFTPQFSDREERRFIAERITPDMTFLDIGAGCGAGSLFVALRAGPRARVLAVEPQPLLYERLVYNLRQNPAATVKALDCAIADVEGPVKLFYNPFDLAETSMRIVNVDTGGGSFNASAKSLATLAHEEGLARIDADEARRRGRGRSGAGTFPDQRAGSRLAARAGHGLFAREMGRRSARPAGKPGLCPGRAHSGLCDV